MLYCGTSVTVTAHLHLVIAFLVGRALSASTNPASFTVQISTSVGARFERSQRWKVALVIWDGEFWSPRRHGRSDDLA